MAKNKMLISVMGMGYVGIGEYESTVDGVRTISYTAWTNMLRRCRYRGYATVDAWLCYQKFAKWYDTSKPASDWVMVVGDGKHYSPDTVTWAPKGTQGAKPKVFLLDGVEVLITNLKQYCIDHGLSLGSMNHVYYGSRAGYKGYTSTVPMVTVAMECTVSVIGYNSGGISSKSVGYRQWLKVLRHVRKGTATVCDEWLDYQKFAVWHASVSTRGCDRAVLAEGSSHYSPGGCAMVSKDSPAKEWTFLYRGVRTTRSNLSEWCRWEELNYYKMQAVYKGSLESHRGYTRCVR